MSENILVFGSTGTLGKEIIAKRRNFLSPSHSSVDITQFDEYTTRIPLDILAGEIILAIDNNLEGIIHIGGKKDTLYNLAKRVNSYVERLTREETGFNLPKDLSLNTDKWRKIKNELGYI